MPTQVGDVTKRLFLHTESGKLCLGFTPVDTAGVYEALVAGMPVKLDTATGKITKLLAADANYLCIGVCLDSVSDFDGVKNSNDMVRITVMTPGYAVVKCITGEASVVAGPVKVSGYNSTLNLTEVVATGATAATMIGYALQPAITSGTEIDVLIKL